MVEDPLATLQPASRSSSGSKLTGGAKSAGSGSGPAECPGKDNGKISKRPPKVKNVQVT